ncbi:MAG: YXWGXW repeat-containing protein [Phycisphaerae bacterium]|jgi:hypothetical protein
MKVLRVMLVGLIGVALVTLVGCHHKERVVVHETEYVEPEGGYVIVDEPPPPLIVEYRPPCPSADCIWIDGYWHWDNHRYVWNRGRWSVPPHHGAVWVAPRYERHENRYHYTPGHWEGGEHHEQAPERRESPGPRGGPEGGHEEHR